ncbi:MAG: alpha/beta hydrolase [Leucobacter sp.]
MDSGIHGGGAGGGAGNARLAGEEPKNPEKHEEPLRRSPMRRRVLAAIAVVAAAALAFSACTPLLSLLPGTNRTVKPSYEPPATPEGTVEGFGAQQPNWVDCGNGMQCADVLAPLDWDDLSGEQIKLRLVKKPASGAEPLGTLFVNPGGPGSSGVDYVAENIDHSVPQEVQAAYDVIGWDPRGVAASTPVECLDAAEMDDYLFGIDEHADLEVGSDEWIDASLRETEEFGAACQNRTGPLLGNVDTASTVRDLDMLRSIVGDDALNYLGFSYGTYIGARYADAYPERVGRLVLDGAMDPTSTLADVVREQTLGFEQALRAYVTDCLGRSDCPLAGDVDQGMGQIRSLLDRVEDQPLRGADGRMVNSGTLLTAIITPLYSQNSWSYLDQLITSVGEGDAEVALSLADFYYDREGGQYLSNSTEAFAAINCLDYPSAELDRKRMRAEAAELEKIAPTIGKFQGYGDLSCAGWPYPGAADRAPVTGEGAAPILVVGTTGDPATPYKWAVSLAEQLESGVLVTFKGEGHTAYGDSECVDAVVDDYLLTGAVPAKDPQCT